MVSHLNKLILLHFFLHVLLSNCSAQNWLPVGSEWTYTMSEWGRDAGTNLLRIEGTTHIHNQNVVILTRESLTCDERPSTEYLYKKNNKLFYYEKEIDDFRLLYDFGVGVDDYFYIPLWDGIRRQGRDTLYIRVDSIGSFSINNLKLKKYYFRADFDIPPVAQIGPHDRKRVIIEDIGNLVNLFHVVENGACDWYHMRDLICFKHPDHGWINIVNNGCNLVGDVKIPSSDQLFKIYPNPVSNEISIEIINEIPEKITLYSLTGKTVRIWQKSNQISNKNKITLSISDISLGIYMLEIESNNLSYRTHQKVIIN